MKFTLVLVAMLGVISPIGCKKDKDSGQPATSGAPSIPPAGTPSTTPSAGGTATAGGVPPCLLGSWVVGENGYTFNADMSGTTTMKEHPIFTWSMKDPKTGVLVLPAHVISESTDTPRTEFEFTVDCSVNAVTIHGYPAKKSP